MNKLNVSTFFIVDKQTLFRQAIAAELCREYPGVVVREFNDGIDLLQNHENERPDLILMGCDDGNLIETLTSLHPSVKVLVVLEDTSHNHRSSVMRTGACGVLSKQAELIEFKMAVEEILGNGQYYWSGEERKQLLTAGQPDTPHPCLSSTLSSREISIVQLICREYTNKQIGYILSLSAHTIRNHKVRIMRKLGVCNNSGLVRYAVSTGLVDAAGSAGPG